MFKGLHQFATKTKPIEINRAANVHPIQSADVLLAPENCQKHLKNIKSLLNLPPKLFDTLYYKAITNFAEFVQSLPQTRHGAFSHRGGFLDHGIERASRALTLCANYFFPENRTLHMVSPQEALWIYAVFTAALFLDVGKLAVKYQVTLCDKNGNAIREWLPYAASMMKQANFYKYDFVKENRDQLGWLVTSLLARQLLDNPTDATTPSDTTINGGFNWIASDPNVLEAWLRMFSGESRHANSFLTVIPLADAQIMDQYLNNFKTPGGAQPVGLFNNSIFDGTHMPTGLDDGSHINQAGAVKAFLDWLNKALADGTISKNVDGAMIREEKEGVFISSEIFKAFVSANPRYQNAGGIEQQFREQLESLILSAGDLNNKYAYIKGGLAGQKNAQWLLFTNPSLLFAMGTPTELPGVIMPRQNTAPGRAPMAKPS